MISARHRERTPRAGLAIGLLAAVLGSAGCVPPWQERPLAFLVGEVAPGSTLAGCDLAAQTLVATSSLHLDPACLYGGGVEIRASDVVLDCRGARIEDVSGTRSRGILVASPSDVPLSNVTIRNCVVAGFLNNVRVTRDGFKTLPAGGEYDAAFSDVVVENSHLYRSRGSGVFVDGYVTDVTLRGLEIAGSGSVGVYLEAGSRDGRVEDSWIHHNGYGDVVPEGIPFSFGGGELRYESTGREGIAIDGSRGNRISGNRIHDNSAGGIFLYKNCGEYATERPSQWWVRRYGADDNVISGNRIEREKTGVWIGSRMAENQYFMDCSDPTYLSGAFRRIHRDYAARNAVEENVFLAVHFGVRIEDDSSRVSDNWFLADEPGAQAVILGTKHRSEVLSEPVRDTVISRNHALVVGNDGPYRWIHGHVATTFDDNRSHLADVEQGLAVDLAPGDPPPINPFLFVIRFWAP